MTVSSNTIIFYLFATSVLCGCLDQSEGCLDVLASNFDVEANENCCCEYPQLELSFSHQYGEDIFVLGDSLTNDLGQGFQVLDLGFYLSDIQVRQEERWLSINDSVAYQQADNGTPVDYDDVIAISRNQFSYPVGSFRQSGQFDALRVSVGLNPPQSSVVNSSLEEENVLSSPGLLYDTETMTYRDLFVEIVSNSDTLTIALPAQTDFSSLLFESTNSKERGFDLEYSLQIDYKIWFHNLDLTAIEQINSQLQSNVEESITLVKQ